MTLVTAVHANGYKNVTNSAKIELTFRSFSINITYVCSCLEQTKALTSTNVTYVRRQMFDVICECSLRTTFQISSYFSYILSFLSTFICFYLPRGSLSNISKRKWLLKHLKLHYCSSPY